MTTFESIGLAEPILKALVTEGYTEPTPIQTQAIPHIMAGRDLQGIAQTGTGKTAAFALPILHRLLEKRLQPARRGCRVLVLSPTRELASQIAESFRAYGRQTGLRTALMFGGVPKARQSKAVANGIDILVATPGRLMDHMQDGAVSLNGVDGPAIGAIAAGAGTGAGAATGTGAAAAGATGLGCAECHASSAAMRVGKNPVACDGSPAFPLKLKPASECPPCGLGP